MPKGTALTDPFTRTVATGWGTAPGGLAWSATGAGGTVSGTDASVNGSAGIHSIPVANAYRFTYLATFSQADVDIQVDASISALPTGAPVELGNLLFRGTTTSSYYLARAQVETTGAVTLRLYTPSGVLLDSYTLPLSLLTYTAGAVLRVRVQAWGPALRVRAWLATGSEPAHWYIQTTDTERLIAGWVGVRSGVAGGNTNASPVIVTYDNFISLQVNDFPRDMAPVEQLIAPGADTTTDYRTWPWVSITTYLSRVAPLEIGAGRPDNLSGGQTSSVANTLDNDGRFTPGHPGSPYWPGITVGCPEWTIVAGRTEHFGYVDAWAPYWDRSAKIGRCNLTASGALKRIAGRKRALRSPVYRAYTRSAIQPVGYWPLTEGVNATQGAAAIPAGGPAVRGVPDPLGVLSSGVLPEWGAAAMAGWLPSGVSLARGGNAQVIPPAVGAAHWAVDCVVNMGTERSGANGLGPVVYVSGTFNGTSSLDWALDLSAAGPTDATDFLDLEWFNVFPTSSSANVVAHIPATIWDGQPHHLRLDVTQSGGNVNWTVYLDGVATSGTITTLTLQQPSLIQLNPQYWSAAQQWGVTDLALFGGSVASVATFASATKGYAGELATDRLTRLCAEESVPLTITGTSTTAMGPQDTAILADLLRACEAADGGVLYDGAGPGIGYRTLSTRYNRAADITADMAQKQVGTPYLPRHDDSGLFNEATVSRQFGGSVTISRSDGDLGTNRLQSYPADPGEPLSLVADDGLANSASWRVHVGTVLALRYPLATLDLGATPAKLAEWLARPAAGARLDILNPDLVAVGHAPGDVQLFVEGYRLTVGRAVWSVAGNCSSADPYRVWSIEDSGNLGRLDTDGSTVTVAASAGATSLTVATTAGAPLWITTANQASMFPFYAYVGGWKVNVTGISGASSPQTFTVDPLPGAIKVGASVSVWRPGVLAL